MVTCVFKKPSVMTDALFHYCPGCGHSIVHRLIGEVIDELGIADKIIGVPPAGCAVVAYNYFKIDMGEAPHGRAIAVATGIKRCLPDRVVFSYQGDGDIAAIGAAETIHAASRGENITAFFINNGLYGMTGGQMAPTTVIKQPTTTTPGGRSAKRDGYPLDLSRMLALTDGCVYIERTMVISPKTILRTKKAIKKTFEIQLKGLGFSLVEVLSPCPVNWKMTPVKACTWVESVLAKTYPVGIIKEL